GYGVNVTQPNGGTQLEYVRGSNVSQIFGSLTSNGSIVIANPNGIWFGPNAQVDVAGLAAVAAKPTDADVQSFITGHSLNLSQAGNANAAVVNQGLIKISDAGLGAFVAPGVRNDGVIAAKLGKVQLSSGTTATLDFYGDGLISIAVSGQTLAQAIDPSTGQPMSAAVGNTGTIKADGGTVLITANVASNVVNDAINVSGVVQAQSVSEQNGQIVLDGGSNGNVQVAGTLDASGTGTGQTGGTVKVLGSQVALNAGAKIDVSGDAGGGTVDVGGDFHGTGPDHNAQTTYVDANATIDADANTSGNGGQVAVWSDQDTVFNGAITARGGSTAGNGGYVETSGRSLAVGHDASINTTALRGATGTWLLDPENVTITNSPGDDTATNSGGTITFTPEGGTGTALISAGDIVADLNTNNVVITTTTTPNPDPGQVGDIEVNAAINWGSGSTTLTLNAAHNIDVNAGISSTSGSLAMTAANMVTISAPISMSGSVAVHGPVTFNDGAANPLVSTGSGQHYFNAATLAANATLTDSLGELVFSGAVNGPFTLNASGATFGSTVNIGQLNASGATLDNNVTTAGGQTYTDLTLQNNVMLTDTASGAISFGSVTGSSNSLTVVDDAVPTFSGTVSGLTSVTLAPNTTTATIGVGDSSLHALTGTVKYDFVSTGGLANLAASTATIGIGTTGDSGTITLTQLGAASHTTLGKLDLVNGAGGTITISGAYDGNGALTVQSGTGGIALDANVTTGGAQTYS
ncbi:MAG: beta strand repeat-containing protein, partial [Stellaceae bacterium]